MPTYKTSSITCLRPNDKIPTPKEIVAHLDKNVIGQDAAKRRLAVAVYNHYKRIHANLFGVGKKGPFGDVHIDKSNILMLGPTGTGKTFLLQNIAQFLGVPLYIQDCSKLTAEGYYGGDIEDILTGLISASNNNVANAQVGIVCLDEIDKNAVRHCANKKGGRDINGESVQQGLLKIVEGTQATLDSKHSKIKGGDGAEIDTSNILFIATGAFVGIENIVEERLEETGFYDTQDNDIAPSLLDQVTAHDLIKYGFLPEFIGRFPVITHTNPIGVFDLARIVSEPRNSILNQYRKLAYLDGINLSFSEDAILTIAQEAEATGTGARGIRSILETVLNDFMYEAADLTSNPEAVSLPGLKISPAPKKASTKKTTATSKSTTSKSTPKNGSDSKSDSQKTEIDFVIDREYCLRVLHPNNYQTLFSSRA